MEKLLALIAGVFLCLNSFAQGKGETVRFQDYVGPGNLMARVAIEKGLCEKAGIKCQLQVLASGPLGVQALMSKSIEAGFFTNVVMVGPVSQGAKMKMVVGAATSNPAILIAGNHATFPNASRPWPQFRVDLKGKKVGVPARGSLMEFILAWMLTKSGMKTDDVTIVAVGGPDTAYGALVSKQVDALMMFDPAGSMCAVLSTCKVIWRAATDSQPAEMFSHNSGGNGIVLTQDFIERNPHLVEAIISVFKEADAFINNPANFEEVIQITRKYFRLEVPRGDEIIRYSIKLAIDSKNYVARLDRKALQAQLDFMLETKMVDKLPPLSSFVMANAP
jgi:NitT/TauT family transport system substrate-binding protein